MVCDVLRVCVVCDVLEACATLLNSDVVCNVWGLVQPPQLWDVVCDGLRVCVVCDGLTVCVVDIVGSMKWCIVYN